MDTLVEEAVKTCHPCQAATDTPCQQPLEMSVLQNGPWEMLSMDYCSEILPNGEYVLVILDNYSRYSVVEFVSSTSARVLIPRLDNIIATFGIPVEIKSDNGPPFKSKDMENYVADKGFYHRRVTPLWPQANSQAENIMKILEKIIRVAVLEKKNVKQEIHRFLLNYRATPHPSTGVSPAELIFQGRQYRTKLPEVLRTYNDDTIRRKDKEAKEKMKQYADRKRYVKYSDLTVGDLVLVRQKRTKKIDTPFNPTPYKIIMRKGSMVTAKSANGHQLTRNVTFFKRFLEDDFSDDTRVADDNLGDDSEVEVAPLIDNNNPEDIDAASEVIEETRFPRRNRRAPQYLSDYDTDI